MRKIRKKKKKEIMEEYKRKVKIITSIVIVVTIIVLSAIVIMIFLHPPTIYYSGKYGEELRHLIDNYMNDPRWSNKTIYRTVLREIFYQYYLTLYNTSSGVNTSFIITKDRSVAIKTFLATNESLHIETYGNGTYYYILALDPNGHIRLSNYAIAGNSVHDFPVNATLYNDTYIILVTNSTKTVKGYVYLWRKPPKDLTTILKLYPIEYTTWLFETWVKDRYVIRPIDFNELSSTRPPWEIVDVNVKEINSLEAVLLLNRLYNLTGFETHIIAIDLDGDGEMDHVSLMIKYGKDPRAYGSAILDYILRDVNIYVNYKEYLFKHVVYNGEIWMILDPLYEAKYVPSYIVDKEIYEFVGIIK